jgi:glycerate kinase
MRQRISIILDSFKGSIGAVELGAAVARRLAARLPDAEIENFPCSDGGDGFAQAVGYHFPSETVECRADGPLGRPRTAHYVWSADRRLAIVEAAEANGLARLAEDERDPLRTTTVGVGELLLDAAARGARRIILGVGGSATVDGGVGMAHALGVRFLDAARRPLGPEIGALARLADIELPPEPPLPGVALDVASDVRTRLLGPRAASAVWIYGPQKGGKEASLSQIEDCLRRVDEVVRDRLGRAYGELPMGGAAGGLAAGLAAFAGAKLHSGMALFDEWTGLAGQVGRSAVVVTGEGRLDEQTAEGKVAGYVAELARAADVPVIALCGSVGPHEVPLDAVVALTESGMSERACIARPLDALDRVLPRLTAAVRSALG